MILLSIFNSCMLVVFVLITENFFIKYNYDKNKINTLEGLSGTLIVLCGHYSYREIMMKIFIIKSF